MKSIFKRAHLTVFRILDRFETLVTFCVFWVFNDMIQYIYNNLLSYIFMVLTYLIMWVVYLPMYMFFLPFSVAVELFHYTEKTKIKKPKTEFTEEEAYDLINKKKNGII